MLSEAPRVNVVHGLEIALHVREEHGGLHYVRQPRTFPGERVFQVREDLIHLLDYAALHHGAVATERYLAGDVHVLAHAQRSR